MYETELKFLDISVPELTTKLGDLSAQDRGEVFVEAWVLDTPSQRFKEKHEICRVRTLGERSFITFKTDLQVDGPLKTMKEYETEVGDAQVMVEILQAMGYAITHHIQKYRHIWTYKDVEIVFDRHPGIPPYIEIEGEKDAVFSCCTDLGLEPTQACALSSFAIFEKYGVDGTALTFED